MPATAWTARDRMLAMIEHQVPDRIPLDIWATGEVWKKLQDHLGPGVDVHERLHIDGFAWTGPNYVGPPDPQPNAAGETTDFWGMRYKMVDYGSGAYREQVFHPLAECKTIDDLERYRWPQADWWDFSQVKQITAKKHDVQLVQAGYMAIFYFHNLTRGLEASLMDPYDDPAFTHHLLNRISDYFHEYHRRLFEAADGLIDVAQVTDDLGSQNGPLLSMEVFREFYLPHMRRFINLCKRFNVKVFHHDDGAMASFLPDLVDAGIDLLNPIQWRCPGMEVETLKKQWGRKLCFHGGVDNQQTLPLGAPEDVRKEVRHLIDTLACDKTGYILAPCHNLQVVSPVENILAMYDEAWEYGKL